jgi:hypothetical protein
VVVRDGSVKSRGLVKLFRNYAPVAWQDLLAALPDEDQGD